MIRARTALGGMVTAPHHLAAEAGRSVLAEGGNAVEAMVAAAAAIAVVYPHMNAIGGDGFWLIAEPGQAPVAIRACGAAAARATEGFYAEAGHTGSLPTRGPLAALTVAGAVGGWAAALRVAEDWRGSRPALPLSRLLDDAIRHGRDGVPVTSSQAALTAQKLGELAGQPGFATVYAPDGHPPALHQILKQPALAATFQRLAEAGLDDFYRGDIARANAAGLEATGSPLSLADMEAWHPAVVAPLTLRIPGATVWNQPPPTQGAASLAILGIFDRLGVTVAEGFDHVHGLVEATKRAFLLRNAHIGDPGAMTVDPQSWLTPEALAAEAAHIDRQRAAPWPQPARAGDTVWLGAADAAGRVVSYIQSIYWEFGSGVVVPETGVLWQNRGSGFGLGAAAGANRLAPGRLPFHTLNPAMARLDDGRLIAYGTMGGEGQPQTQAAVFTRHVRFGQDIQAAITAPRWLLGRTWGAGTTSLKLESRIDPILADQLAAAGHAVEMVDAWDDLMGHAGAVSVHPSGVIEGASDPRSDGAVAAV